MTERVLVTGATGFVAGHCVADLLAHGYRVRATVRDAGAVERYVHLTESVDPGMLEIVEADLTGDAGWAEAVDGCAFVLHVASPFPAAAVSEEELTRPAVEGTLRVLRACGDSGSVRRVVLTSSIAAIIAGRDPHDRTVRTEQDWSVLETSPAYHRSKTRAERAAWDFVATLPVDARFDLVVLNPGMVLGPLQRPGVGTSVGVIKRLLDRSAPGSPRIGFSVVDVRDLAVAHRLAMQVPEAAGKRYICAGEHIWMREFAAVLADRFAPRGYRVPTRQLPDRLVRLVARFDPSLRMALYYLGREERVSSARAQQELGWSMRPVEQTVVDTAASLIDLAVVRPSRRRVGSGGRRGRGHLSALGGRHRERLLDEHVFARGDRT